MSFKEDTLNAFSGVLQHLQSLKPPILSLWGILIIPNSTTSWEPISYNIVREHTTKKRDVSKLDMG
ncbi:hypothetical protein B0H65DRAFT_455716 [Neurospora tetraspora]|uniref:Uncharacterized protein n=1 Tax=Neurospora tetraspora TaxID=94610 RepID=A0AAE0JKP7_9PEZI|nr:hypothetical protein B0H65DRAFT_455716 [Neurospora tetraspora]